MGNVLAMEYSSKLWNIQVSSGIFKYGPSNMDSMGRLFSLFIQAAWLLVMVIYAGEKIAVTKTSRMHSFSSKCIFQRPSIKCSGAQCAVRRQHQPI